MLRELYDTVYDRMGPFSVDVDRMGHDYHVTLTFDGQQVTGIDWSFPVAFFRASFEAVESE